MLCNIITKYQLQPLDIMFIKNFISHKIQKYMTTYKSTFMLKSFKYQLIPHLIQINNTHPQNFYHFFQ